ncbi:hypothetical protein [Streptomyces cupreus]|uniref:Uncharacterized protein n=1 Tax=Streptomyces cupreus TaxID=2759956 RepID=A0A7X1J367_9ACTN|nr:hypothetical protein [Streptomyces cupreus]MBC2902794.1 hypothetical protein [Streptomyces cupreus]
MLRATTWTHGRQGALIGASAAVVCLGGLLAACAGGGEGDGYVAVGAPSGPARTAAPTGEVELVPLESPASKTARGSAPPANSTSASSTSADPQRGTSNTPTPAPPPEGADPGRTTASSPTPTPSPVTPAALTWSEPKREAAEKRWCEKVMLGFHNSGGSPVRSGTVTFGTHVIGALGIDWGTVESVEELPVPVEAGARKEKTWTVCVDAWRVPLGMHVETRDVSVRWK